MISFTSTDPITITDSLTNPAGKYQVGHLTAPSATGA
jgi:hypothetical protein